MSQISGRRRQRVDWLRWGVAGLALLLLLAILAVRLTEGPGFLFLRQDHTWQTMQARGSWRVGMDPSFPPFEFLDEQGSPVGFDVDLARHLAQGWGLRLEIAAMGYDSLLDAVKAGQVDAAISAIPYDPRMTQDFAFSEPYFEAGVRLVVRQGSPIQAVADLAGRRVAVEWGSLGDMVGRHLQREDIAMELVPYATPQEAVDALVNDATIDALLIDNVTLREAQGQGAPIVAVGPALESNPYVIVLPLPASQLQEEVARALQAMVADGTLAELEARWFGAP